MDSINPLFAAVVGSFIRWLLTLAASWLVGHSVWTQGEASTFVLGLTLAGVTLLWSLWTRYRSRIKLLTALESPAGMTEDELKAKIASGKGAALLIALLLAVAIGSSACATMTPRHVATVSETSLKTAVRGFGASELALYESHLYPALTLEVHKAINKTLADISGLGANLTQVIQAWPANAPTPKEIVTLVTKINSLVQTVTVLLPEGAAKVDLLGYTSQMQTFINGILVPIIGQEARVRLWGEPVLAMGGGL